MVAAAVGAGGQRVGFVQKRRGLRSTSHLCNNGADNGQRASSVSLKHALNSREPTNWLKPREPGRNQLPPDSPLPPSPPRSAPSTSFLSRALTVGGGQRSCLIETTESLCATLSSVVIVVVLFVRFVQEEKGAARK